MLARRPSAASKPLAESIRQQIGCFVRRSEQDVGRHGPRPKPLRRFRRGRRAYFTSPRKSGAREVDPAVALYFDAFSSRDPDPLRLKTLCYSVTGRSEISQSLPLNCEI